MANIQNFSDALLWVAGADGHLIQKCPNHEVKKLQALGATILVPTIASFFSMFCLAKLYVHNFFIVLMIAVVWMLIMFVIDRALVLSMDKEKAGIITITLRFFISLLLSVVISHPLMITLHSDEVYQYKNEEIDSKSQSDLKEIDKEIDALNKEINKAQDFINALGKLKDAESLGQKQTVSMPDGSSRQSTGQSPGCSERSKCQAIKNELKNMENTKTNLENQLRSLMGRKNRILYENQQDMEHSKGISVQTKILFKLVTDGDLFLSVSIIIYSLLFISIDMAALFAKLLIKTACYDDLIKEAKSKFPIESIVNDYKNGILDEKYISTDQFLLKSPLNNISNQIQASRNLNSSINMEGNTITSIGTQSNHITHNITSNYLPLKEEVENNVKSGVVAGVVLTFIASITGLLDKLIKIGEQLDIWKKLVGKFCTFFGVC